ncbi:MAG: GntR family transcriptional regulator [Proteobacteria bacterium]|nr:GntR family transcriptional regulator [Pseudomonadota bacterium]
MKPINRTLSDHLVEAMRERILSSDLPPNHAIRQDVLAAELGVSKIPLREALARLEQEGLLRSHAHRGFFVCALSREEAEEVYALRLKLEPDAVALAAERATEVERSTAEQVLATLDRVTTKHGNGVGAFNRAFHLALIRPCRQLTTISILERLQVLSERYVRKHLEQLGRDERANEEHRQICKAWLARKPTKVHQLMARHIDKTLRDLRQQLKTASA